MTVQLSIEQSKAVRQLSDWYADKKGQQEFYLAGYAGVGKTTIANFAIEELKEKHSVGRVATAAFTGKAASVMRRKGVTSAQTIHSLIYSPVEDKVTGELKFILSEESDAADCDLIVLDECSMVDEKMAEDLRSFGKKILVLGDPGQLPPVKGFGAFTSRTPDVFLQEVHRQAAESPILELATIARKGGRLPKDFMRGNVCVVGLDKQSQPLIYNKDTQPICGLNRVRWTYNRRIRHLRGFSGERPQTGERLICCKNNRIGGYFNGGIATLDTFHGSHGQSGALDLDITFDDLPKPKHGLEVDPYLFDNHFQNGTAKKIEVLPGRRRLDEFDWGYVITCHKAQGSSWNHVTVIDDSACFKDERSRWLYTAITRAEAGLTVLTRS